MDFYKIIVLVPFEKDEKKIKRNTFNLQLDWNAKLRPIVRRKNEQFLAKVAFQRTLRFFSIMAPAKIM